ncbi:MAG: hypothetical protein L3J41_14905 [Melioribacteraceae bacterium]|nr:hypothetical protein [Melioribacteraceae bacterium]
MTNKKEIGKNTEAYKKLKQYVLQNNYLSIKQVYTFLEGAGYSYSKETIKKYIQQLKKEEVLFSAGRGYYSTIAKEFPLNINYTANLVELIKTNYPLLQFSLWSTKMLAGLFHHTQNQFFTFIYAESDTLIILRDFLLDNGKDVILNPSKNEKNLILKNKSIILRPSITRSKSQNSVASIEKIVIDLLLESERLNLIDFTEYIRLFENLLSSYRINISYLLDYAERRKVDDKLKELLANTLMPH